MMMTVATERSLRGDDAVHHDSYNLRREWESSCAKAMGFSNESCSKMLMQNGDEPRTTTPAAPTEPTMRVINLLQPTLDKKSYDPTTISSRHHQHDPWMQNAIRIDESIDEMANLIQRKRYAYVSIVSALLDDDEHKMSPEERSVLESTVLSFAATTANQIESLKQSISEQTSDTSQHVCAGIISILFLRLRQEVADPMTALQKERSRKAISILREPFHCGDIDATSTRKLPRKQQQQQDGWDDNDLDAMLDLDDDAAPANQRFIPSNKANKRRRTADWIVDAYYNDQGAAVDESAVPTTRPPSRFLVANQQQPATSTPSPEAKKMSPKAISQKLFFSRKPQPPQPSQVVPLPYNQETDTQELQKESALLSATLQNDLDSVQKVEETMTTVSTLLSRFSDLVSDQQDDVQEIAQSTFRAKQNVTKGQDSLLKATETTKKSKHYMATFVTCMAILLLFFNWVTR